MDVRVVKSLAMRRFIEWREPTDAGAAKNHSVQDSVAQDLAVLSDEAIHRLAGADGRWRRKEP